MWVPQAAHFTACQTLHPQPGTLTQPYLAGFFSTRLHPPSRLHHPGIPHNPTVAEQARMLSLTSEIWTLCSLPTCSSYPLSPENSCLSNMAQLKHFSPVSLQASPECRIHPVPNVQSCYTTLLTSVSVKRSIGKELFRNIYIFSWYGMMQSLKKKKQKKNVGSPWRRNSQTTWCLARVCYY